MDLQHLHNLGSRVEERSLQMNAEAAMVRTALWENSAQGGYTVAPGAKETRQMLQGPPRIIRSARQADWHRSHVATTVHQHMARLAAQSLSPGNIRDELTNKAPLPFTRKDYRR